MLNPIWFSCTSNEIELGFKDVPSCEVSEDINIVDLLVDNNKEYTTAIAAPSVAVNIPPVIPPIIITINDKLGIASKSTFIAWENVNIKYTYESLSGVLANNENVCIIIAEK